MENCKFLNPFYVTHAVISCDDGKRLNYLKDCSALQDCKQSMKPDFTFLWSACELFLPVTYKILNNCALACHVWKWKRGSCNCAVFLLTLRSSRAHSLTSDSRWWRLLLKYDGTPAEIIFRLSAKRRSPFKSAGASVQSTTGSRGVRISGSNAGYAKFRSSVKGADYPPHSPVCPSLPLLCVTVCHHVLTVLCQFRIPQHLFNQIPPSPTEDNVSPLTVCSPPYLTVSFDASVSIFNAWCRCDTR